MVLLSRLCKSDEQLTGVISLYLHNTYSYTTLQQHNTWIQRYLCMHSVCTFFHLFLYVFIFWLRKNMKIETNTREDFEKQNVFLDESNKTVNTRQVQDWSSAFKLINRSRSNHLPVCYYFIIFQFIYKNSTYYNI